MSEAARSSFRVNNYTVTNVFGPPGLPSTDCTHLCSPLCLLSHSLLHPCFIRWIIVVGPGLFLWITRSDLPVGFMLRIPSSRFLPSQKNHYNHKSVRLIQARLHIHFQILPFLMGSLQSRSLSPPPGQEPDETRYYSIYSSLIFSPFLICFFMFLTKLFSFSF